MDEQQQTDWWARGDMCEECNTWYCRRHNPNKGERNVIPLYGPLYTTGLESEMLGPIEVFFLDRHYAAIGERTPVGQAVYSGKSYDGKSGSLSAADLVASAATMWLGKLFGSGQLAKPTAVIAVPAKPERRGISLPAIMAQAIGTELEIPVIAPFRWLAGTAQAKTLAKDERQRALDSGLETVGAVPAGTVLLVDDVFETGATISVIARRLLQAGATRVVAFAPSRAVGLRGF